MIHDAQYLDEELPARASFGHSAIGYSVALAEAAFVGRVPTGIDPMDAAPLTCAGVTTYKAVKVAGTRSSDLVAVFGIGCETTAG